MDLSKAFDCFSYYLLITKLNEYRFRINSLKLVQDYLTNRKQRTRINSAYNSWEQIIFGVPKGSILGPLSLNIFLCDLFFIMDDNDFGNYADDSTPYARGNDMEGVIFKLQNSSKILFFNGLWITK